LFQRASLFHPIAPDPYIRVVMATPYIGVELDSQRQVKQAQ
jgi:hypothetical protein